MPSIKGSVFLISLSCFITIVCTISWNLRWWYCQKLLYYFVIFLFRILLAILDFLFYMKFKVFFQFLWRTSLKYWLGFIYFCILLLVVWPFQNISPSSPWASNVFTTFGIYSISFLSFLHFHVHFSIS